MEYILYVDHEYNISYSCMEQAKKVRKIETWKLEYQRGDLLNKLKTFSENTKISSKNDFKMSYSWPAGKITLEKSKMEKWKNERMNKIY